MSNFKTFFGAALDFLFPIPETVRTLEKTSADTLSAILPASEHVDENNFSLFSYSDERVKHLVWEIKYYQNTHVADQIGEAMANLIKKQIEPANNKEKYCVVPVPITSRRLRERGFNHTTLLASSILKFLPANFELSENLIKKVRHTPRQRSLENRAERQTNLDGAFALTETKFATNQNIILIDDVLTTGATLREITNVFRTAGAKNIFGFTIAH